MSGDPRCPHCGAPQPAAGQTQHGRTCPLANDRMALRFRESQAEAAARERKKLGRGVRWQFGEWMVRR